MAAGGLRRDERGRPRRGGFLIDPEPYSVGRIKLDADRPGVRDIDLALEVEDLAAGLSSQLVQGQGAGNLRISNRPAARARRSRPGRAAILCRGLTLQGPRRPASTPSSAGSSVSSGSRKARACPARRGSGPGRRTRRGSSGWPGPWASASRPVFWSSIEATGTTRRAPVASLSTIR